MQKRRHSMHWVDGRVTSAHVLQTAAACTLHDSAHLQRLMWDELSSVIKLSRLPARARIYGHVLRHAKCSQTVNPVHVAGRKASDLIAIRATPLLGRDMAQNLCQEVRVVQHFLHGVCTASSLWSYH